MIEILEKLKILYPQYQQKEDDLNILETIIDGLYDENDFFHACKMLFKTTNYKTLYPFKNKETFIKFKNLDREIFPDWVDNLTFNDQTALKENYKIIVAYCFGDREQFTCNHPDILELIYEYHKLGIPYWIISAYIQETFNTSNQDIPKNKLLELMNQGDRFIQGCRKIFKRQQNFKSLLKEKGLNFIEAIEGSVKVKACG